LTRVLHVITDLGVGGAETMLLKLASLMDRSRFELHVVTMVSGPLAERLRSMAIPVRELGMVRGVPNPLAIPRLMGAIRAARPDVVQTWMYHADLLAGIAGSLLGGIPTLWGIRHCNLDPTLNKEMTLHTAKWCARLSGWIPRKIVCCAESARKVHAGFGYDENKMLVIPNGFDCDAFRPQREARLSVRQELGLPPDAVIIGVVGRYDPQKDHATFIRAAGVLNQLAPGPYFVMCGRGVDYENRTLMSLAESSGVADRVRLLGSRQDIPRVMAAMDVATSSSRGEAFPNVVGEAMACGVPCVVTDVGDSSLIVDRYGIVVPPQDPAAIALAWKNILDQGRRYRQELGRAARAHIQTNFSLSSTVARYEALYEECAEPAPHASAQLTGSRC
jgi:glycosyltransferase involved in cell wall biosynthesis